MGGVGCSSLSSTMQGHFEHCVLRSSYDGNTYPCVQIRVYVSGAWAYTPKGLIPMTLLLPILTGLLVFVLLLVVPSILGANLAGGVEIVLYLVIAIAAGMAIARRRRRVAA